jgi:ABC-2 type transport system permease protein
MKIGRLLAMARKEAIQLRRDARSMALAFLLPVFMLLFFGYAITWDIRNIRLAIVNEDGGQRSREVVSALEGSGYFEVVEYLADRRRIDDELDRGDVSGILVIPADFTRKLAARERAVVQLLLDGSDANTATIALNYADAILARYSQSVLLDGRRLVLPVTAQARVWYNPTLASRHMIVPGLIAVIMSIIAAMLTALTIAREWERGTMEQLAATPVGRLEVVFGKLLPYLVIAAFDVAITVIAGMFIFGVPFNGSVLLLAAMTLLFLLGALGLGIFISATLKSQILATQVAMVATYLPALLLSGFLFDIRSMPIVLRAVTYIVPAKYYIAVTRGVLLKGVGLDVLWIHGLSMIVFACVGLGLATFAFHKRIDA